MTDIILRPWSESETRRAQEMYAAGIGPKRIGVQLGRTGRAVKRHLDLAAMSPAKRKEFYDKRKAQRIARGETGAPSLRKITGMYDAAGKPPPDDLLRDRDYRLGLAPRDLTAAIMGDPLPGMSALDRRRG